MGLSKISITVYCPDVHDVRAVTQLHREIVTRGWGEHPRTQPPVHDDVIEVSDELGGGVQLDLVVTRSPF